MILQSNVERILRSTIDGTEYTDSPQSRVEALLLELKAAIEGGGGGGGYVLPTASTTVKGGIKVGSGLEMDGEVLNATGADAAITEDIATNVEVGGIPSGSTIAKDTTLTELTKRMFVKETAPMVTFTATGSGVMEDGTSVTPTLTLNITNKGTATPVEIEFYSGSTSLDTQEYVPGTNSYTYTMTTPITTNTTVKGVLKYKKSDNTNGTIEKSISYTFVMASYYGAVTTAPTDKAGIIALTKNVKNSKSQTATFNLSNQRSCYCYPASFGNLTSIKDANNFEYISSYTRTTVVVDGTNYNVYTLTDPVTASGFKQVYA